MERDARDGTFSETEDVASCTECAGLMPALPDSDAAEASSASLYAIHRACGRRRRTNKDR